MNTSGLCECGCGEPAPIATRSHARKGWVRGQPKRFVHGHHFRLPRPERRKQLRWVEEDRGFVTQCWVWQLAIQKSSGYGLTGKPGEGRRAHLAHRVNYEALRGPIPDGAQLDHLCRVRCCVNPSHLEPVTQVVNCQRGRQAKLTREQADTIRSITGRTIADIAAEYGVSANAIGDIRRGKTWKLAPK